MLEFQPFTTERTWTQDGIPILSAEVAVPRPVTVNNRFSRRIQQYYQLQSRAFLRYCERWLFPQAVTEYHAALAASAPLPHFQAELSYQITYQEQGLLSLYTQSRERTLPGPSLLTRRGDTWDLSTGYPVPLADFFPPKSGWKKQLLRLAAESIQQQESAGIAHYHPHWNKALKRYFNRENFYLTEEGLVFFFPMYSIAPAAEGIPTFLLPFGADGFQPRRAPSPAENDSSV